MDSSSLAQQVFSIAIGGQAGPISQAPGQIAIGINAGVMGVDIVNSIAGSIVRDIGICSGIQWSY